MARESETQAFAKKRRITLGDVLALLATLLVIASVYAANHQVRSNYLANLRLQTAERLSLKATRLTGEISSLVSLVEGLGATVAQEPDISAQTFNARADHLLRHTDIVKSLALARDLKIQIVYPLEKNEDALGLNYKDHPNQLTVIKKALTTKSAMVDGPIDLVQGGAALLVFVPLYTSDTANAWGLMSAIIDLERLFSESNWIADTSDLTVGVAVQNPDGNRGRAVYGNPDAFSGLPVEQTISFAETQWTIAARPASGWKEPTRRIIERNVIIDGTGLIIILAIWGIVFLMRERGRNLDVLKDREKKLKSLSERMRIALQASKIGVWEFNVETHDMFWDNRMREIYEVPDGADLPDLNEWASRLHPEDREREMENISRSIEDKKDFQSTFRIIREDGSVRFIRVLGSSYFEPNQGQNLIGVNADVTQDMQLQEDLRQSNIEANRRNQALQDAHKRLKHTALHDTLTGIPNRKFLEDAFVTGFEPSSLEPPYAALHIDLDRFKEINDTLGHAGGDAMLRHVARMLTSLSVPGDFIARVGGDEFVIVTHWDGNDEEMSRRAKAIITALSKPFHYASHQCRVSASVGIAWSDEVSASAMRDTLVNASIAVAEAKKAGRARSIIFNATLKTAAINTKRLADEILAGLENDEFFAFYQPQITARSHQLAGVEALVRWNHPEHGILSPAAFITTAETIGAIARIDSAVLKHASRQHQIWRENNVNVPRIAVNLSAQRLSDETLIKAIQEHKFEPGVLSFEFVESISFDEPDAKIDEIAEQIRAMGIDIEIDDFGTGYASITSLLSLSPKRLKVDRQLVQPVTTDPRQRRLVGSIVEIGRSLGIEIIAEGVETIEQVEILERLGCDIFQGYLFSKPMPGDQLAQFAQEKPWLRLFQDQLH